MTGFQMSTLIVVDQATIDRTAGYGNTQDSHAATMSRVLDNDICDVDLVEDLKRIVTATYTTEIWPDAEFNFVTPKLMNDALVEVLLVWAKACPDWHAGQQKFFSTLAYVTGGDLKKRMPIVRAWEWIKVLSENPDAKVPKKYRKKAA